MCTVVYICDRLQEKGAYSAHNLEYMSFIYQRVAQSALYHVMQAISRCHTPTERYRQKHATSLQEKCFQSGNETTYMYKANGWRRHRSVFTAEWRLEYTTDRRRSCANSKVL